MILKKLETLFVVFLIMTLVFNSCNPYEKCSQYYQKPQIVLCYAIYDSSLQNKKSINYKKIDSIYKKIETLDKSLELKRYNEIYSGIIIPFRNSSDSILVKLTDYSGKVTLLHIWYRRIIEQCDIADKKFVMKFDNIHFSYPVNYVTTEKIYDHFYDNYNPPDAPYTLYFATIVDSLDR